MAKNKRQPKKKFKEVANNRAVADNKQDVKKSKGDKLAWIAIFISILSILLNLFLNVILDSWIYQPILEVSSYIYNSSLFVTVYNSGLKEAVIESAGFCYYDEYRKKCDNGTLKNFLDFQVVKPKESSTLNLRSGINRWDIIEGKSATNFKTTWGIILCQSGNKCDIYLFKNTPYCAEEERFIEEGYSRVIEKSFKKIPITLPDYNEKYGAPVLVMTPLDC